MNNSENKMHDISMMIALIDIPINKEEKKYKSHFNETFSDYKKKLQRSNGDRKVEDEERLKSLYSPHYYHLWGTHDLAIFSIVDGFTFAHRLFHKNSFKESNNENNANDGNKLNFNYQIISGIASISCENIQEKYKRINDSKTFPFISITKLKINNSFLIGNGYIFIEKIINLIKKIVSKKSKNNNLDFIVLESLCYNELTLILFSDSITLLYDTLIELREKEINCFNNDKDYGKVIDNCLLSDFYRNEPNKPDEISKHHIFTGTYSFFGYDPNIIESNDIKLSNKINFNLKWIVKPGHIGVLMKILKVDNKILKEEINTEIGKSVLSFKKDFKSMKEVYSFHSTFNKIDKHIDKIETIISFPTKNNFNDSTHLISVKDKLIEANPFKQNVVQDIRKYLRKSHVSKFLTERIIKMYNNYSLCVEDPYLYTYFIGFSNFLKIVYKSIKHFSESSNNENSLMEFHDILRYYTSTFDKAFNNLFINSNYMVDVTDVILEHNGGLQKLHAIYDTAYKEIQRIFNRDSYDGFVYIDGYERTKSSRHNIRLNYAHIFNPEIFITVCVKEVANFYLSKLDLSLERNKKLSPEIKILLSLKSITSDNSVIESIAEKMKFKDDLSKYLKSVLDTNFTKYIFEDFTMFRILFRSDVELFSYWFWMIIMQTSDNYEVCKSDTGDNNIQLNKEIFIKALLRIIVLVNLSENKDEINKMKFNPPCFQLNNLWYEYFNDIEIFVKELIKNKKMKEFKETLGILLAHLTKKELLNNEVKIKEMKNKKENSDNTPPNNLNFIRDAIKKNKRDAFDLIANPITQNQIFHENFLLYSFYCYLSDLKEMNQNKNPMLLRDKNGDSILEKEKNIHSAFGPVLSDQSGGIYIHGFENRKFYFICKTKLLSELWDYTFLYKKKQFVEFSQPLQ